MKAHKLTQLDLARALLDFDSDEASIIEVLREFESDIQLRMRDLDQTPPANLNRYLAIVHEIANSLGTAWCFHAALGVRAIEDQIRGGIAADLAEQQEAIRAWVDAACADVASVLRTSASGCDPFALHLAGMH